MMIMLNWLMTILIFRCLYHHHSTVTQCSVIPYSTQSIVRYLFFFFFFLKVFHLMWCDVIISLYLSTHLSINLSIYLTIYFHPYIHLIHPSIYLSEVLHSPPRASEELVVSSGAAAQQEERRPGSHQRPSTGELMDEWVSWRDGLIDGWMDGWVHGMDWLMDR